MKISVVTPTLNQRPFLAECVESVLSQRGDFELEYLVRDGGSTDGSAEWLRRRSEADPRLRWVSQPDRGQSHAINQGWAEASGEALAWLNSDDLYAPGALARVARAFEAHPEWMWLCGRCRIVDEQGRSARSFIAAYKWFMLRPWRRWKLLLENYLPQPAVFIRREAFERIGPLDESLVYSMDYDYWLRLAREGPLGLIEEELACFRVHARSKTGSTIEPAFREAHRVASRHARAWGMPWASWINFWLYYVRTSLIYMALNRGLGAR